MICPQQCCLNTAGAALQTMQWHVTALFIRAPRQMSLSFTKTRKGMAVDGQRGRGGGSAVCSRCGAFSPVGGILNRCTGFVFWLRHRWVSSTPATLCSSEQYLFTRWFLLGEVPAWGGCAEFNRKRNKTFPTLSLFFFSAARERSFGFHIQVSCVAAKPVRRF